MPTINQLVRKSRHDKVRKSKSPVLGFRFNSIAKKNTVKYGINSHDNLCNIDSTFTYFD